MSKPLTVTIPHSLGPAEARRRLDEGFARIAAQFGQNAKLAKDWNGDRMVLRMHNAREVDQRTAPEFVGIVRQLAERAALPMPRVYLIDADQPNAFATGRSPQNAAVAATTGLLRRMSPEEVAGVMAHELAHVRRPLARREVEDRGVPSVRPRRAHLMHDGLVAQRMVTELLQDAQG